MKSFVTSAFTLLSILTANTNAFAVENEEMVLSQKKIFEISKQSATPHEEVQEAENMLFFKVNPRRTSCIFHEKHIKIQQIYKEIDSLDNKMVDRLHKMSSVHEVTDELLKRLEIFYQMAYPNSWNEEMGKASVKYDKTFAGFGGQLQSISELENLREKISFIMMSFRNMGGKLSTLENVKLLNFKLIENGIDSFKFKFIPDHYDSMENKDIFKLGYYSSFQDHVRKKRDNHSQICLSKKFNPNTQTDNDILKLSPRELQHQNDEKVHWNLGAHVWVCNGIHEIDSECDHKKQLSHSYINRVEEQGLSGIAGVSGTTDRLLTVGLLMDLDDDQIKDWLKAIIVYLAGGKNHSVIECLEAARSFHGLINSNSYMELFEATDLLDERQQIDQKIIEVNQMRSINQL